MKSFCHCLFSAVLLTVAGPLVALADDSGPEKPSDSAESKNLFEQLDSDADGILTRDEITDDQRQSFDRLLRLGDANEDGKLTRQEFQAATAEQPAPANRVGTGRPAGRGGRGRENPEEFFRRLDRNGDGALSRDELPEFLRERMSRLFDQAGKDSIQLEELVRLRQRSGGAERGSRPGQPGLGAGNPEETFQRLDSNGDGKLLLAEVPEPARRFFGQMFERLGKGRDESISREEFIQAARRFAERDRQQPAGERSPDDRRPRSDGRPANRPGSPDGPPRGPRFLRLIDSNRDNRLSPEELTQITARFAELDDNGDGYLDIRELFGAPPQNRGDRPQMDARPRDNRSPDARPQDRPRRPAADTETPSGNSPRRANSSTPRGSRRFDLDAIFQRLDRNGNQSIDRDEAIGRLKENFDRVDANNDGRISQQELKNARPGS